MTPRFCVVGLGNPGPKYRSTRHNIGFDWLDRAVEQLTGKSPEYIEKFEAQYCSFELSGQDVHCLKPQTFMNLSGKAVGKWAKKHQGEVRYLIVLDEMDLELGRLRLKWSGGDAGHRGLRSVCEVLGTKEVPRLRIGVGRPADEASDHVLESFRPEEKLVMRSVLDAAGEHLRAFVEESESEILNRINGFRPVSSEGAKA